LEKAAEKSINFERTVEPIKNHKYYEIAAFLLDDSMGPNYMNLVIRLGL